MKGLAKNEVPWDENDTKVSGEESEIKYALRHIHDMEVQIQDLFQRYGHALDRIIALEKGEKKEGSSRKVFGYMGREM